MSAEFRFTPNVVVGLAIMLLGLTLLGDRLGLVAVWDVLRYWPALLILFGVSVVVQALRGRTPDERPEQPIVSPPLVLAIVIVALLASRHTARGRESVRVDERDTVSVHAVLSSNRHTSRAEEFRSARMTSVMGGSRLDLRGATIPPGGEAVVDVFALMGGVEIFVPREWRVDLEVVPIMGGVKDERFRVERRNASEKPSETAPDPDAPVAPAAPGPAAAAKPGGEPVTGRDEPLEPLERETSGPPSGPDAPRVIVRGFIMMGGVTVKP